MKPYMLLLLFVAAVVAGTAVIAATIEPRYDVLARRDASRMAAKAMELLYPSAAAATPDAGIQKTELPKEVKDRRQEFLVRMNVMTDAMSDQIGPSRRVAVYWATVGTAVEDAAIVVWEVREKSGKRTYTSAVVFLYVQGSWRPFPEEFGAD